LIVRWPGMIPEGRTTDIPAITTDFYPTFLEMAGLPATPAQNPDGKSILSVLKGATAFERGPLYWHYPHYSNQGGRPGSAIRVGDYKLIEFFEDLHLELYDLKADLSEKHNLAAAQPAKAKELRQMLADWRVAVDADMPTGMPVGVRVPAAAAPMHSDGSAPWYDARGQRGNAAVPAAAGFRYRWSGPDFAPMDD
jgi:arylsulfatase A-like enzyme